MYPEDIHSPNFSLPTSLIAYLDSKPVGFLFGFDKISHKEIPAGLRNHIVNPSIRQESQLMGILPQNKDLKILQQS